MSLGLNQAAAAACLPTGCGGGESSAPYWGVLMNTVSQLCSRCRDVPRCQPKS